MLAVVFAATHPERVSHLILMHPMARMTPRRATTGAGPTRRPASATSSSRCWPAGAPGRTAPTASPGARRAPNPEFVRVVGALGAALVLARDDGEADGAGRQDGRPRDPAPRPGADPDPRPARMRGRWTPATPGTSPSTSPAPTSSSCRAGTRSRSATGFEEYMEAVEQFTTGAVHRSVATSGRSRRSCSPTSSARPRFAAELGDRRWRETAGAPRPAHPRTRRRLRRRGRSSRPATASWRPSTARPGRSAARQTIGQRVGDLGIELRAGLHTGEVEVIGADVGGMAVHIGARIGALGGARRGPGVLDRPRPRRRLRDRVRRARRARAQGRAGEWNLYEVTSAER